MRKQHSRDFLQVWQGDSPSRRVNVDTLWTCGLSSSPSLSTQVPLPFLFLAYLTVPAEKAMAPHSSTLAWKIPWTEGPGRLQSMRSLRVGHD